MPTVRISPQCVQVDDLCYHFADPTAADNFEACVATSDADHCTTLVKGALQKVEPVRNASAVAATENPSV